MVSYTKTQTTYILELTEKEAKLLCGIVQNPLRTDETQEELAFRQATWEALNPPTAGGKE